MKITIPTTGLLNKENINIEANVTDYSKIFGVGSEENITYRKNSGFYFLSDHNSNGLVKCINGPTHIVYLEPYTTNIGIRLVVNFSEISKYCSNIKINKNTHIESVDCFMFPNTVVDENLKEELEYGYAKLFLEESNIKFNLNKVYRYKKGMYTRIRADLNNDIILSNNETYKKNDILWFNVIPLSWKVNQNENIAITRDIILGGIPFDTKLRYKKKTNFEQTYLNGHLNNDVLSDLESTIPYTPIGRQYKKTRFY